PSRRPKCSQREFTVVVALLLSPRRVAFGGNVVLPHPCRNGEMVQGVPLRSVARALVGDGYAMQGVLPVSSQIDSQLSKGTPKRVSKSRFRKASASARSDGSAAHIDSISQPRTSRSQPGPRTPSRCANRTVTEHVMLDPLPPPPALGAPCSNSSQSGSARVASFGSVNPYMAANCAENSAATSNSPVAVVGNFVLDGLSQPDGT